MRNRKRDREEWRRKRRDFPASAGIQGLFGDSDMPDIVSGWALYEDALIFNTSINLNETVRVNENFYIGK